MEYKIVQTSMAKPHRPDRGIHEGNVAGRVQDMRQSGGEDQGETEHLLRTGAGSVYILPEVEDGESRQVRDKAKKIDLLGLIRRLFPAQDVHFFYTRSHLSALQNCELLFSINF